MSAEPSPPPGPDLAWVNRRILAERLNWPDGVRADCEMFESLNRGWVLFWRRENNTRNFEHPAGFVATHTDSRQTVCGETLAELGEAMRTTPLDRHHSWHKVCCSRVAEQLPKRDYS